MKYLDLLKSEKRLSEELPKLPEAPFDSFSSDQRRHVSEKRLVETVFEWPEWCASDCEHWEAIDLPKSGVTIGCVIKEEDQETWRRLDRMAACPRSDKCT
jgi:hypothetical protein